MMTAVQWLLNEWQSLETTLPNSLIEKVLEMEKQQLNDAYNADRPNLTCYEENTAFTEYYNETFNNED
jgi:hypothetical protein